MGWDVVQIGLKHNLPVDDPIATAKEVAKRMNRNIRLVFENMYNYDEINNIVSVTEGDNYVELAKIDVGSPEPYLQMTAKQYQIKEILQKASIEKLREAKFASEFASCLLDEIEEPFELYEIESTDSNRDDYLYIRIFKENVDLDVSVCERWRMWEKVFHPDYHFRDWLSNYRKKIYERAMMFGCKEVIICSDQGPAMMIYENMNFEADKLKEYAKSEKYYDDSGWLEPEKVKSWREKAKQVSFPSVFKSNFEFSDDEFVEVIYDDFNDLQ